MIATANGTISARVQDFEYRGLLARDGEKAKRFEEFFKATQTDEGATHIIWSRNEPISSRPPGASWARSVEKRITDSSTPDPNLARSGRWLNQGIAIAALKFFETTSDLLPGEPYIYSSPLGDLVAEFEAKKGNLTSIIGLHSTLLYAIIGGTPIKRVISAQSGEQELRSTLSKLTDSLTTGKHGALDSGY